MAYGTVNADVIQSSVANTSLGAGNASIMKNRIINGAMIISQRGTSAVTLDNTDQYTLDRWAGRENTDGTATIIQSSTAPAGYINSLLFTVTSADTSLAATQFARILQKIEGLNITDLAWGTASALTVTLSFWVRCSVTGTFGGSLENSDANRSYPFTYTISAANTWEQKSITITGDTTGTWLTTNGTGIQVQLSLGAGSSLSGTAGAWAAADYLNATGATNLMATNGATFYITGVQLEVGSSATGFEYVNYQTSLANCQRYYENIALNTPTYQEYAFQASTATSAQGTIPFKVPKRAAPTVAIIGTVYSQNASMGSSAQATISAYSATTTSNGIRITASSSLYTAGNVCGFYNYDGGANTGFSFTAEL